MKTIELELVRNKTKPVAEFLDGLALLSTANGLTSYFAAKAVTNAMLRTGVERRCAAVKKALKQFSVVVSIAANKRGLPTVRVYAPSKQIEILL